MEIGEYSVDDLNLYYRNCYIFNKKTREMDTVERFIYDGDDVFLAVKEHANYLPLNMIEDTPSFSSLRNNGIYCYFLIKKPIRQWRKAVTADNLQLNQVVVWGKNRDMDLEIPWRNQVRPFFSPGKYPTVDEAEEEMKSGEYLSRAFSSKFAFAIPVAGPGVQLMRLGTQIGIYDDSHFKLNKKLSCFKEELEQYSEVELC